MARFQHQKQPHNMRRRLLSACLFLFVFLLFLGGISGLSEDTTQRQYDSLDQALSRDITSCYALEGSYPPSLDYIREKYGLTYDEDLFYVDYHAEGANIPPEYTIIVKED